MYVCMYRNFHYLSTEKVRHSGIFITSIVEEVSLPAFYAILILDVSLSFALIH
jgi:hypothetical protein